MDNFDQQMIRTSAVPALLSNVVALWAIEAIPMHLMLVAVFCAVWSVSGAGLVYWAAIVRGYQPQPAPDSRPTGATLARP